MGANDGAIFCYSLPRIISPAIQCSFCAYMWEMYTTEFGWSMAEYGTISSLYNFTQIFSFVGFGAIFDEVIKGDGNWTKGIEVIVTYLLLIILPIKWHGVKTPYVDSVLGSTSDFWHVLLFGPIRFPKMKIGRKVSDVLFLFSIPIRLVWAVLYILMKICFLCIVNFGAIAWILSLPFRMVGKCCCLPLRLCRRSQPKIVEEILPVLETLRDPACSACCNTTCCNNFAMRMRHFGRWFGTRTFCLYMITIVHGVGMSAHELSNKALDSYGNLQGAINCNLSFFFASNIVIYLIFSLVKLYVHSKAASAETFYLLAIIFLVLQIPILPIFGFLTDEGDPPEAGNDEPKLEHYALLAALTVFHGTIVFLIFSGGPLTFYLALFILGGHKVLMNFGNLVLFGALNGTSWINMAITAIHNAFGKRQAHQWIASVCVPLQAITFLILFAHNWWWNKGNWFNYILVIATGAINSVFVTYANIMMSKVAGDNKVNKRQWLFLGLFYSGTNAVVFPCMLVMFNSFGKDMPLINFAWKCIRFGIRYCFPTVYRTFTFVFIVLNGIGLVAVWMVYTNTTFLTQN